MSRVNSSESFLNNKNIAPNLEVIASQPNVRGGQFVGGQVQLGQTAQQVGPSSEEAMFASLADIASGIGKSLDIYADIGKKVDQEKITKIQNKFDELDNSNLTPEEKQDQLDKALREVWTPTVGNSWRESLNNTVNKKWLSDDARDEFEQKRYRKEFASFLARPENQIKTQSPDLEQVFQAEYVANNPTALYNSWYKIKSFETNSQIIQRTVQDQTEMFRFAIDTSIQIPNQQQLQQILLGNTTLRDQFKPFMDLQAQANLSMDLTSFTSVVYDVLDKSIRQQLDPKTTLPDTYEALARELPSLAAKKAQQIFNASMTLKLEKDQQDATDSIKLTTTRFDESTDKLNTGEIYLNDLVRQIPRLDLPKNQKREAFQGLIPKIYEQFDQAIKTGKDHTLMERFPSWNSMSVVEKLDAVQFYVESWLAKGTNKEQLLSALDYTPEELAKIKLSKDEVIYRTIIDSGKLKTMLDPKVSEQLKDEISKNVSGIGITLDSLSSYSSIPDIKKQLDASLNLVASKTGLSLEALQRLYLLPKTQNQDMDYALPETKALMPDPLMLNPNINIPEWIKTLSQEDLKALQNRGLDLNDFAGLRQYVTVSQQIIKEGVAQIKRVTIDEQKAAEAQTKAELELAKEAAKPKFKADQLAKQAEKWQPGFGKGNTSNESIAMGVLTGKLAKDGETKEFRAMLFQVMQAQNIYQNYQIRQSTVTTSLPKSQEVLDAEEFLQDVQREIPFMFQYTDALGKLSFLLRESLPEFNRSIPTLTAAQRMTTEESRVEIVSEFLPRLDEMLRGNVSLDLSSVPSNPIDSDGTWSSQARFTFVQTLQFGRMALSRESTEKDRKTFGEMFGTVLDRIGNNVQPRDYLRSDQGKYDLTLLSLMAKEYKKAIDRDGTIPEIHGADYFRTRALIVGNWSKETDVDSLLLKLDDPQEQQYVQANLAIPFLISKVSAGYRQTLATDISPRGDFAQQYIFKNEDAIRVTSGLIGQPSYILIADDIKPRLADLRLSDKPITPSDDNWTADTLLTRINGALKENYSITDLSNAMRPVLLTTIPQDQLDRMSPADQVRTGAIVLQTINEGNPGLLIHAMDLFFNNSFGVNSKFLQPETIRGQSKLNLMFSFIDTALDVNHRMTSPEAENQRIGISPVNSFVISKGNVTNSAKNERTVVQHAATIYGQTPITSWSNVAWFQNLNQVHNQGVSKEFYEHLVSKYPPADLQGENKNEKGKADGPFYLLGAQVLDTKSSSVRAKLAMLYPWLTAHGLTDQDIMISQDIRKAKPSIDDFTISGIVRTNLGKIVKTSILENLNQDITTQEFLERVNNRYLALGGQIPFINPKRFKPTEPGFAELQQDLRITRSQQSKLPTWDWIYRSPNGIPLVSLNNDVLSTDNDFFGSTLINQLKREQKIKERKEADARKQAEERLRRGPKL